jgi:hypothetical protein
MRNSLMTIAALALTAALPAAAQDLKELRNDLKELQSELRNITKKALQDAGVKEARGKQRATDKAFKKAASELPAIKDLDGKLKELKAQIAALTKQRAELLETSAALADTRAALEQAAAGMQKALEVFPGFKEINDRKTAMEAKIKAAGAKAGGKNASATFALRINCAAEKDYTDPAGNRWSADAFFEEGKWGYVDGSAIFRDDLEKIENTTMHDVYLNERWGLSEYRVTAPNGSYTVTLHFAETYDGIFDAGERLFDVTIEGKTVLKDFDPFKAAGGKSNTAISRSFEIKLSDGVVNIGFVMDIQNPMINGIEIVQKK